MLSYKQCQLISLSLQVYFFVWNDVQARAYGLTWQLRPCVRPFAVFCIKHLLVILWLTSRNVEYIVWKMLCNASYNTYIAMMISQTDRSYHISFYYYMKLLLYINALQGSKIQIMKLFCRLKKFIYKQFLFIFMKIQKVYNLTKCNFSSFLKITLKNESPILIKYTIYPRSAKIKLTMHSNWGTYKGHQSR